jgi:uncharacterized membrane protein YfcA
MSHTESMSVDIFFPIAEISLNPFLILGLGLVGGFASGMLGIGSGVVITPALMMVGVPPLIAVASQLNNSIGTNFIGFLGYWRKRDVDFGLAGYLFIGGIGGAFAELYLLDWLHQDGVAYKRMALVYAVVLSVLGIAMLVQNGKALTKAKSNHKAVMMRHWMIYIPFHRIFTRSRTEMSILVPLGVGVMTGMLTSTLGGGNSLFMMPIVGYLIGRTSPVVAGTTLLAGFAITVAVTLVHGLKSEPFDIFLVFILLFGSTVGSQIGVRSSYSLPRPYLGLLGGVVILLIGSKFIYDLFKLDVGTAAMTTITTHDDSLAEGIISAVNPWTEAFLHFFQHAPFLYVLSGILGVIFTSMFIEKLLHRMTYSRRRKA